MVSWTLVLALGLGLAVAGCANPEREWLKPDQPYTAEEFRRDRAACVTDGKVDEACMKSRGWVSVSPPKPEKGAAQPPPSTRGTPRY